MEAARGEPSRAIPQRGYYPCSRPPEASRRANGELSPASSDGITGRGADGAPQPTRRLWWGRCERVLPRRPGRLLPVGDRSKTVPRGFLDVGEAVAGAAHGLDVAGFVGVRLDLLADVLDVDVGRAQLAVEVPVPEVAHDLLAGVDPAR